MTFPRFRLLTALMAMAMALAACTSTPPADHVLLGRLFDARHGRVVENAAVVVAGGRVLCAGPRDSCRWHRDTPVHDYGQAMLLPGLIDLHVHARPHYAGTFVPAGVTTIRDANNTLSMLAALREVPGAPRLVASGPMIDGPRGVLVGGDNDGPVDDGEALDPDRMPLVAADAAQARAAVAALAAAGVQWIKLYEQLPPSAFHAAVESARAAGLPVMTDLGMALTRGLAGAEIDALQASVAGIDTLEHLGGVALAYRRLGGDPADARLDPALLDRIAQAIADSGTAVVPTLAATTRFAGAALPDPVPLPGSAIVTPRFGAHWAWLERQLAAPGPGARARADLRIARALLPRLAAAGVRIGAGSDLPAAPGLLPGAAVHQELQALVDAGLSPVQALQSATWVAADILGREDLGRLEPGAHADIVVVDGDPVRDVLASRRITAVWFEGRPVDLAAAWTSVASVLDDAAREAAE